MNAIHILGKFFHLFWSCEHLQKLWKEFHFVIQNIIKKQFTMSPVFYSLYYISDDYFTLDIKKYAHYSFVTGEKMYLGFRTH